MLLGVAEWVTALLSAKKEETRTSRREKNELVDILSPLTGRAQPNAYAVGGKSRLSASERGVGRGEGSSVLVTQKRGPICGSEGKNNFSGVGKENSLEEETGLAGKTQKERKAARLVAFKRTRAGKGGGRLYAGSLPFCEVERKTRISSEKPWGGGVSRITSTGGERAYVCFPGKGEGGESLPEKGGEDTVKEICHQREKEEHLSRT